MSNPTFATCGTLLVIDSQFEKSRANRKIEALEKSRKSGKCDIKLIK